MTHQLIASEFIKSCAVTGYEIMISVFCIHGYVHEVLWLVLRLRLDGVGRDIRPLLPVVAHHHGRCLIFTSPSASRNHIQHTVLCRETIRIVLQRTVRLVCQSLGRRETNDSFGFTGVPVVRSILIMFALLFVACNASEFLAMPIRIVRQRIAQFGAIQTVITERIDTVSAQQHIFDRCLCSVGTQPVTVH